MVPFSVTFLFRILNFAVLIGLAIYIFFRYFYASIKAHMITKKAALEHLDEQKAVLALHQKELDEQLLVQENTYEQLHKKISEWRAAENQRIADRNYEIEARKKLLFDRMLVKRKNVALDRLRGRVMPRAAQEARAQLREIFSASDRSHAYIHHVLKRMQ